MKRDEGRIFLTALVVYLAFWNPVISTCMNWGHLDMAVSFVETGRWEASATRLYGSCEVIVIEGRLQPLVPPGMTVLIVPIYAAWRLLAGPATTLGGFEALNGLLSILGAVAAAFTAVLVAAVAGRLGASRRGRLLVAGLFAFGTQSFLFGSTFYRETLVGLAVLAALRLVLVPGSWWRSVAAGALAGIATTIALPAGLMAALLLALVAWSRRLPHVLGLLLGLAVPASALVAHNVWLFGGPFRTAYFYEPRLVGVEWPKTSVLADILAGPETGLLVCSPFLAAGFWALARHVRAARPEALAVAAFALGTLLAIASWESQFGDTGGRTCGLGPRQWFAAIPLLAAYAGVGLDGLARRWLLALAIPSVAVGFLGATAGTIHENLGLPYAVKVWLSGTGTTVLFREALPRWLAFDTLHTVVSRPDVRAADLLPLVQTAEGLRLAANQAVTLLLNLVVLAGAGWLVHRLWQPGPRYDHVVGSARAVAAGPHGAP